MNHLAAARWRWIVAVLICAAGMIAFTFYGHEDGVDELIKSERAEQHIPGVAVIVLKDGKVIKAAAFGVADVELKAPATTDTVFRIQSMSKQFTATGLMMLVEEGKVGLEDPVSRYLNGCPATWQSMTVRHLLTQTSGLADFINEPTVNLRLDSTEEELLKSIVQQPLKFEPGDAWDYSNSNYHLLAMIIRRVSGKWYGDFLAERIFKPLGMTKTAVIREGEIVRGRAMGYSRKKGRLQPASFVAPSIAGYGGGGIRSTVLDLAKWDAALYTDQLLTRATLEQMWTPVKLNNGTSHGYGFGWEIDQKSDHRRIWHAGRWLGFAAQIDRYVDDQLTVIALANLSGASLGRMTRKIASTYLPGLSLPDYQPIVDDEPQVTARFFDVLRRSREGRLRSEDFTPDVWAYLASRTEQTRMDMAALGPIEKLILVERSEQDGQRSYRYQARFKNTNFIMHFVITRDDKISAMMPEFNQ
jgi:CubicO group peptidase (beta-lactamase class C family)